MTVSTPFPPVPATTPGGLLLVAALMLPALGCVLAFLLGGRWPARLALLVAPIALGLAAAIAVVELRSQSAIVSVVGGWSPPLGIALRADGLSAALLLTTALVMGAVIAFARAPFATATGVKEARQPYAFWGLLLGVWAGLSAVFLANDLFSLYVALELLTFAAVPLVCLDGRAETVAAALRYLLFAVLGSLLYLLGAGLLYGSFGTLDITMLAGRVADDPVGRVAIMLMTAGLLAKTALFPLYIWLPPAHAGAPPAASAVLSALVVKGSFFITIRLWFDVAPELLDEVAAQLLALLGAGAILFGSARALRQARLKMLVAYSTVAQVGYAFLMFGLASPRDAARIGQVAAGAAGQIADDALRGGVLQAISHAFAKAALFLAAGLIAEGVGHDRIDRLGGVGRALPLTVLGFGLGGLSLIGLPPSGGFWAKWLLLDSAVEGGRWWWGAVILVGGLFACGYLLRVLLPALDRAAPEIVLRSRISRGRQLVVLGLALCSLFLGLLALAPVDLLRIGRPAAAEASAP